MKVDFASFLDYPMDQGATAVAVMREHNYQELYDVIDFHGEQITEGREKLATFLSIIWG